MRTRPELGLILPVHGTSFADTLAVARAAEAAGLARLWVPDHLLNETRPRAGVLECWSVLSALAAASERIPIGTLVLTAAFREPALLAKQSATLANLAPGRFTLGLGAGGFTYQATCEQFGFPTLSGRERVQQLEETVQCLRAAWRDDPASFEGRFARIRNLRVYPRPARPIPIVLAARRPAMLRATAALADGWNCPLPHELESGLAAIERAGRDPATLDVSTFAITVIGADEAAARRALERAGPAAQRYGDVETHHAFGTPAQVAERLAKLAEQGASHVALDVRGVPHDEALDLIAGEVAPLLA